MSAEMFHPATVQWFADAIGTPTSTQRAAWDSIRRRQHTLVAAPTGSGKTLAAFLIAIDDLLEEGIATALPDEVRVVYVSPLKALSADIHRNLEMPRTGIAAAAAAMGLAAPEITAAVRTGDTSQSQRAAAIRKPPHILVTTPESLYLLLTSPRSRDMLRTVRTVIVDEIHAVVSSRRGAHLALSLERLRQVATEPIVRIGLSATQKPIEDVAQFLVGGESETRCTVIDQGHRRAMDLGIEMPKSPLDAVMSHEVWGEYYDRLTSLISSHRTTLVFVNTRRLAERIAHHLTERLGEEAVTAHHGSLSKERRLDAEERLKSGRLRALVATASLELGIDVGGVDLVCQIGSPRRIATLLQRVGRSGHALAGTPKGRVFPATRDDLVECIALLRSVRGGELDRILPHDAPLDVLCQQITAECACDDYSEDDLFALVRRAWPYRQLDRAEFDAVVAMAADGFATRRGRRGALLHRDEVNSRVRARRGARLLALTSGGAIPEVADYRVILDPDDTFIGTLNEDFAIESARGDIFQLGNASWRILQVASGTVRVADAHGAPPTIPFWFGEAPGRSDELSASVSALREEIQSRFSDEPERQRQMLSTSAGIDDGAAAEAIGYLAEGHRALGVLPSQHTLVLERFFDESGGMQLVLHAPFGSRINRAWGLALRKRFCRQFNFELQAAATEDAVMLSLGPQHSFPLTDVFRYLHPASARDVLVQAFLDAPVFPTRWRWNTTVALAVPRFRGGRKVPPPLQRMLADDLMAAAFPDAAACLENIPGDREIPDHPLVRQTVHDCLHEAMDFKGLAEVLRRIHAGEIELVARDLPEPSVLAHEVLNSQPYAFLDDAPLEERRSHAVQTRRAFAPAGGDELGILDPEAIDRVRREARAEPRDADECHDALVSSGFLLDGDLDAAGGAFLQPLFDSGRATRAAIRVAQGIRHLLVAAERLPELLAIHPTATLDPPIAPPASRAARPWTLAGACAELLRDRLSMLGPVTVAALAESLGAAQTLVDEALLALEGSGVVLRGTFTQPDVQEWCDRRLLSRMHRQTVARLRAEIEPVSPTDFMRFLFAWQHVASAERLQGIDGLREVLAQLDGVSLAAAAWERDVLPMRLAGYDASLLDTLCLGGEIGWARRSGAEPQGGAIVGHTPVALFARDHTAVWTGNRSTEGASLSEAASRVHDFLRVRGASFVRDLHAALSRDGIDVQAALRELVVAGIVTSDAFAGLRGLLRPAANERAGGRDGAGRWSLLVPEAGQDRDRTLDVVARTLIKRYGVVCRRLLVHEDVDVPWRDLLRVYWRLEARGEVRGGRFVNGWSGEQFASPDAVTRMRETRRRPSTGDVVVISACDPLNLTGVVDSGERVRATTGSRIAYRDGVPAAALEGEFMKPLAPLEPSVAAVVAGELTGRPPIPVVAGFVGRARRRLA